ncbi:unnamed protein product, partial [Amoebophrya sp. A120]
DHQDLLFGNNSSTSNGDFGHHQGGSFGTNAATGGGGGLQDPHNSASKASDLDVEGWLDCVCRNSAVPGPLGEWFAETVILQKGLSVLINGLLELHKNDDLRKIEALSGPILASLAVLLPFDQAISYVADEYILDADFFESLLATMFGRVRKSMFRWESFCAKMKKAEQNCNDVDMAMASSPFECNFNM